MKHYTELLLLEEHIVGRIYECFQAKIADCSSSLGAGTTTLASGFFVFLVISDYHFIIERKTGEETSGSIQ
jgi:hypothetical protein